MKRRPQRTAIVRGEKPSRVLSHADMDSVNEIFVTPTREEALNKVNGALQRTREPDRGRRCTSDTAGTCHMHFTRHQYRDQHVECTHRQQSDTEGVCVWRGE
jgi:hypothetical protein